MKIIFLGAPGAGKGTQAEIVSKEYSIPTISTGAIIREAIKNETVSGKAAKSFIDKGSLVPDEVVIGIIKERLSYDDCKDGFILDGFPRTIPQAQALCAMGEEPDIVVSIEVADETIVTRMSGRRVCPKCGATYHVAYNPPKSENVCDKCSETLTTRSDDKAEVVLKRLDVYHAETEPLEAFYEEKGKLVTVVGQEEVSETTKLTLEAIAKSVNK